MYSINSPPYGGGVGGEAIKKPATDTLAECS